MVVVLTGREMKGGGGGGVGRGDEWGAGADKLRPQDGSGAVTRGFPQTKPHTSWVCVDLRSPATRVGIDTQEIGRKVTAGVG